MFKEKKSKKINVVRIALIFVPIFTAIIMAIFSIELDKNITKKVEIQSNNILKKYKRIKYKLSTSAKIISLNSQIINGIKTKDPKKIRKKLITFSNELNLPFISIHDQNGLCISKIHRLKDDLKDEKNIEYVKNALFNIKKVKKLQKTPSGLALINSLKIKKNQKTIGLVSVGHFFDNFFSFYLKGTNDVDVIFFKENKLLGNSLKDISNKILIDKIKDKKEEKSLFNMTLENQSYKANIFNLFSSDEKIFMIIAINNSKERKTFYQIVFVSILFTLILLITNLYLSKQMNKSRQEVEKKIEINQLFIDKKSEKYKITKREKEVLVFIMKGLTNKEISEKSFIAFSTVRKHIYNLYKKTGAKNRKELTVLFMK